MSYEKNLINIYLHILQEFGLNILLDLLNVKEIRKFIFYRIVEL